MSAKEVQVYSTPGCPWCRKVKQFLDENGVDYHDFNIAEDSVAREEMLKLTDSMAVPTIVIDGDVTVGFEEAVLRDKLGL